MYIMCVQDSAGASQRLLHAVCERDTQLARVRLGDTGRNKKTQAYLAIGRLHRQVQHILQRCLPALGHPHPNPICPSAHHTRPGNVPATGF